MIEANLDQRLTALSKAGWQLRTCYTLRKPDRDDGWQSYHADTLEAVLKRVEQESVAKPQRQVEVAEQKPADLPPGWVALEPVHIRPGESRFGAEKLFPGDGKPILQSSATEAGLLKACRFYDAHKKSGDALPPTFSDPAIANKVARSQVHTGLISTESFK